MTLKVDRVYKGFVSLVESVQDTKGSKPAVEGFVMEVVGFWGGEEGDMVTSVGQGGGEHNQRKP